MSSSVCVDVPAEHTFFGPICGTTLAAGGLIWSPVGSGRLGITGGGALIGGGGGSFGGARGGIGSGGIGGGAKAPPGKAPSFGGLGQTGRRRRSAHMLSS